MRLKAMVTALRPGDAFSIGVRLDWDYNVVKLDLGFWTLWIGFPKN